MDQRQLITELSTIIDEVKTAVLITTGQNNCPRGRWVTPAILTEHPDRIYCFSHPASIKVAHINTHGSVAWLFQTPSLAKVISVAGIARVIDNPALKAELIDLLAQRLITFWKVNIRDSDFVVIETCIQKAEYFSTDQGTTATVDFEGL